MTARNCFNAKIKAGRVPERAGKALLGMLDDFERDARRRLGDDPGSLRGAAMAVSEFASAEAARKSDLLHRTIVAQSNVLRGVNDVNVKLAALRKEGRAPIGLGGEDRSGTYTALSAFLDSDPRELASWNSVSKLAEDIAGRAHAVFAGAIERLRSKAFGLKGEQALELDFLRAAFGQEGSAGAKLDAAAWFKAEGALADGFIDAGGSLAKRESYFPNPVIDEPKARALGEDGFKQLIRDVVDRDKVLDFRTGKPMGEVTFERLLDNAWRSVNAGGAEGVVSAAFRGKTMLANSREAARLFVMRDADAWLQFAESVGTHSSPFAAAVEHIQTMARDTALMKVLGPNPDATLRFMLDVLDRDPGRLATTAEDMAKGGVKAATRVNEKIESRTRTEKKSLQNLYAEVSGQNHVPVSIETARRFADARSLLVGAQLGSAMISSLNDPGTLLMTARMAGLDASNVIHWTTAMLTEKGSETFAAQAGMMMDTLAHTARSVDKVMGDTLRSGAAAKIGGAVIRASGLRKWTEALKGGFWLGAIAHVAHEMPKSFGELDQVFRAGMERVGIGAAEWKIFQAAELYEPRDKAVFLRPQDVAALGGREAQAASEKLAQYVNTWMDSAVIEASPRVRAIVLGDSKPGTISGELRRSLAMYRFFSGGLLYMHGARALARGWDGSRLGHAALTFGVVSLLGALSMQVKEVVQGRDPLTLDPTSAAGRGAWLKAVLQGGGLGVFGDILQVDQTKYGNTWAATFAGPIAGAGENILGDFALKNIRLASQGKETHFLGDGLYAAARYAPGSSLWYGRLAFQRGVVDQLALWADPRTRERFARMEETARKDWNQEYWWRPGRTSPGR